MNNLPLQNNQLIKLVRTGLFLLLTFVLTNSSFSQDYKTHWFFGDHLGLDFSTPTPTLIPINNMISFEASSAISDDNGDLLFYSNSLSIWDRNHNPLPLIGGFLEGNDNSTQGVIFKNPANQNEYYFFYIKAGFTGKKKKTNNNDLFYSIIDATNPLALNVPIEDVQLIWNPHGFSEAMTAVPHCNGIDYWVIIHGDEELIVYLVNATGVHEHNVYNSGITGSQSVGTIKASPNSERLAIALEDGSQTLMLYDFNATNGDITNPIGLSTLNHYGVSFSENSQVLYSSLASNLYIESYDLSNANTLNILPYTGSAFFNMQLAKDGKIYLKNNFASSIGVINDPDNFGTPNFNPSQIPHPGASTGQLGITNFIDAIQPPIPTDFIATTGLCGEVEFSTTCWEGYDFSWDFGDGSTSTLENPTHTYLASGTYNVTATVTLGNVSQLLTGTAEAFVCPTIDCSLPTTVIASNLSSTTTINNGDVVEINGIFTIDNNSTYSDVKFKMAAGSQIIIDNGQTLTLDGCHLFSCTELWKEITVGNGANLDISDYTVIEDAEIAVNWNNGGNLNVSRTIFNRNGAGINLQGATSAPNVEVKSCIFTCRNFPNSFYQSSLSAGAYNALKSNLFNNTPILSPYPYGSLIDPAPTNTRSLYGVITDDVKATIGVSGPAKLRNLFDYLDNGIHITLETDFTVVNNLFSNLSGNNIGTMTGVGINATSKAENSIYIGGNSLQDGNQFKNCYRGANITGFKKIGFSNNELTNTTTSNNFTTPTPLIGHYGLAIFSSGVSSGYTFKISENDVSNFETGVYINQFFSNTPENVINIDNNTIYGNALSNNYCNKGLWVTHTGNGNTLQGILVTENTVTNCEYNAMLFENVLKGLRVENNDELSVVPGNNHSKQVLRFNNCAEFEAIDNANIKTTNNTIIPNGMIGNYITGITLFSCQTSIVTCNEMNYVDVGVLYNQPSDNSHFLNNVMNKAKYGFALVNGAILGPQGGVNQPSGNQWGPNNPTNLTLGQTYVHNTGNVNSNSPLYCEPNNTSNCASGFKTSPCSNQSFLPGEEYSFGLVSTTGPDPECDGYIISTLASAKALVNEINAGNTTDEVIKHNLKRHAYGLIKKDDTGLLMADSDLNDFYTQEEPQNIGKLSLAYELIENQDYYNAESVITNLIPQNIAESNCKTVCGIQISLLITGATSLSPTEINSLTSIANLCLDEGGNATITARALLANYTQNAIDFVDCTEIDFGSSNRSSQQKERTINNSTFKNSAEKDILLYPNPNNGMFIINHQLNENTINLEIVDIRGKLVLNKKLIHNKEQIDLQHVNKGLYFVTLTNEFGKVIYMNKVSVK